MRAVIYTRYSSDLQSETSSIDQHRNCLQYVERQRDDAGKPWQAGEWYKDEEVSGAIQFNNRPEAHKVLEAWERREFDVLVVDKLSRFARNIKDQERVCQRLVFNGMVIIAVNDGYDSRQKGSKTMRQFKGVMNEAHSEEHGDNVRRGLEGTARRGFHAGGKRFGYDIVEVRDPSRKCPYGNPGGQRIGTKLVKNKDQAKIIVRAYEMFADGLSAKTIAHTFNAEGIPSPGKDYDRKVHRTDGKWHPSSIWGNPNRGLGLLHNPLYRGVYTWKRVQWVRDPDTDKFLPRPRGTKEWVERVDEDLRIIPEALYARVKARLTAIKLKTAGLRDRARKQGRNPKVVRWGKPPKYVLSGLMKCAVCGASYTGSGRDKYACATHVECGKTACKNDQRFKRDDAEREILASLSKALSDKAYIKEYESEVRRALAEQRKSVDVHDLTRKLSTAERERDNLVKAIAKSGDDSSPGLLTAYKATEEECARLAGAIDRASKGAKVVDLASGAAKAMRDMLVDLPNQLNDPLIVPGVREALREWMGTITVAPTEAGPVARWHLNKEALLRPADRRMVMLVGVTGFEPATYTSRT